METFKRIYENINQTKKKKEKRNRKPWQTAVQRRNTC